MKNDDNETSNVKALPTKTNKLREVAEDFVKGNPKQWVLVYLIDNEETIHFRWAYGMKKHEGMGLLAVAAHEIAEG